MSQILKWSDDKYTLCDQLTEDTTCTLYLYPLRADFSCVIKPFDCQITDNMIFDPEQQQKLILTQFTVLKLVYIDLQYQRQLIVQYNVNGSWFDVFSSVSEQSTLDLTSMSPLFVSTDPVQFLERYPFKTQVPPNVIQSSAPHLLELIAKQCVPVNQFLTVPAAQLKSLLYDVVCNVQDTLRQIDYKCVVDEIHFGIVQPECCLFLRYALLSTNEYILSDEQVGLLSYYGSKLADAGFDRLKLQVFDRVLRKALAVRGQNLTTFGDEIERMDILTQQEQIFDAVGQHEAFALKLVTDKALSDQQLLLLEFICTVSADIRTKYLKIIMSQHPQQFIGLLKQDFKLKQISLNFLVQCHEFFPVKLQPHILKIAYENRRSIHFQLFASFIQKYKVFSYFACQCVDYDSYVCAGYVASLLQKLSVFVQLQFDQSATLKQMDLFVEEQPAVEALQADAAMMCPVCMDPITQSNRVKFGCGHSICAGCFGRVDWESCCQCRGKLEVFEGVGVVVRLK